MLISKEKRFVFVHVPKTAGDSITSALLPYCSSEFRGHQVGIKHLSAKAIRKRYFGNSQWYHYFRFGVIRNPWDQVHSDYHFCRNHPNPGPKFMAWSQKVQLAKKQSFSEFVEMICGAYGKSGMGLWEYYLSDQNGSSLVSQTIKYEELNTQWSKLLEKVEVPFKPLPKRNVTPNRPDYHDEYSRRSRQLVATKYAVDIEKFGYTFE